MGTTNRAFTHRFFLYSHMNPVTNSAVIAANTTAMTCTDMEPPTHLRQPIRAPQLNN
jgi:hypothetical protein